eukprot:TRINITY_DN5828_c0_g1_i1.p1 TRINITY_DN5828_c0_g1~~TRINITY_DN5828_c0_g1_i1.p1  ORF type:complete len:254 (+),score=59.32 TRINITY_DN5828_c0_g1_i1:135-896(+)
MSGIDTPFIFQNNYLTIEYDELENNLLSQFPGCYVINELQTKQINNKIFKINVWTGVIFIRDGYYKGGCFRFDIYVPKKYPFLEEGEIPNVYFTDSIIPFHPFINEQTGKLGLNEYFNNKWIPLKNQLKDILTIIKDIFNEIPVCTDEKYKNDMILNKKAHELYQTNIKLFKEVVQQNVKDISTLLLDTTTGSMFDFNKTSKKSVFYKFSKWNNELNQFYQYFKLVYVPNNIKNDTENENHGSNNSNNNNNNN